MKKLGQIKVIFAGFDQNNPPADGLWISPEGRAVPVFEHMLSIREKPEDFGLTQQDVAHIQNVKDPSDWAALREIALKLIDQGWVRYRYQGGTYHFEVDDVRRKMRVIDDVLLWAGAYDKEPVLLVDRSGRNLRGTVEDVRTRSIEKMASKKFDKWAWSTAKRTI